MAIDIISRSISVKVWDRQSYLINFIVNFIAFSRLPIVFNLELFYDDCRLLVTFANSLDPDQVIVLYVSVCMVFCRCVCVLSLCVCVCLSFCACMLISLSSHWRRLV